MGSNHCPRGYPYTNILNSVLTLDCPFLKLWSITFVLQLKEMYYLAYYSDTRNRLHLPKFTDSKSTVRYKSLVQEVINIPFFQPATDKFVTEKKTRVLSTGSS